MRSGEPYDPISTHASERVPAHDVAGASPALAAHGWPLRALALAPTDGRCSPPHGLPRPGLEAFGLRVPDLRRRREDRRPGEDPFCGCPARRAVYAQDPKRRLLHRTTRAAPQRRSAADRPGQPDGLGPTSPSACAGHSPASQDAARSSCCQDHGPHSAAASGSPAHSATAHHATTCHPTAR